MPIVGHFRWPFDPEKQPAALHCTVLSWSNASCLTQKSYLHTYLFCLRIMYSVCIHRKSNDLFRRKCLTDNTDLMSSYKDTRRRQAIARIADRMAYCPVTADYLALTLTLIHPVSNWTHWATLRRHPCLSRADTSASSQVNPIFCRSLLITPLQFALSRPGPLLYPGTCQYSACCGIYACGPYGKHV